jgi:hypothetical protein
LLQACAAHIDGQADDMDHPPLPGHRDLDAGDQGDIGQPRRRCSLGDAGGGVVIGQGQHLDPAVARMAYQLSRRERAVGITGMAVQVDGAAHGTAREMPFPGTSL